MMIFLNESRDHKNEHIKGVLKSHVVIWAILMSGRMTSL